MCTVNNLDCIESDWEIHTSHTDFEYKNMLTSVYMLEEINNDIFCQKKEIGKVINEMKEQLENLIINEK